MMDREELQHHIDAAAPLGRADARRLMSLMIGACWPGGPADRTEPVARDWLRRWDPDQLSLELPACSCHAGHCLLCN